MSEFRALLVALALLLTIPVVTTEKLGLCAAPCPIAAKFSANITMTRRTSGPPSPDDFVVARGIVGITHDLAKGSIVYAADVRVTYSTGATIRKWFAGWNTLGTSVRRYLVIEDPTQPPGNGMCHVESDDAFSGGDPFSEMLSRWTRTPTAGSAQPDVESWVYSFGWRNNADGPIFRHFANATTAVGGAPILKSSIDAFNGTHVVATVTTVYSNLGNAPTESLFWPRNVYTDCDSHKIPNLTTVGALSVCGVSDALTLEYGCV
mmetsp:Transcript_1582/g.4120  ORF Transcript_1582/g.4120 Transcript_1582/m.4120 type:complete len:263 (-) Transcript_1582:256-1044(-)